MGGFLALVLLLLVAAAIYGAHQARVQREKDHADMQELARALVDGRDPTLYRVKGFVPSLRSVQIIGESIGLVLGTKNRSTRDGRLQTIDQCLHHLDQQRWEGLEDATQAYVRNAVDRCRISAVVLAARAEAEKHQRAAARATRLETKQRYLNLAIDELRAAAAKVNDAHAAGVLLQEAAQLEASASSSA